MTLFDLEQDCYRRLGFNTGNVDTHTQTRIRHYINETLQALAGEPGMETLTYNSITLASVASTPTYALPQTLTRIRQVRETTNDRTLDPLSMAWWRQAYPDPTAVTGIPTNWVDLGIVGVAKQPSDASSVFIDSTSASDVGICYIEGIRTGGYLRVVQVTMTGTTAVDVSTAITDFIEITKVYLNSPAQGTVTLHEDASGGTELARIPIGETHSRYRLIALAPCPSSAITYSIDYERELAVMSQGNDEPPMPAKFHRLLSIGARVMEYEKQRDLDRMAVAQAQYDRIMKKLKYFLYSQAAGNPNLRGPGANRPSRLGAWYPE